MTNPYAGCYGGYYDQPSYGGWDSGGQMPNPCMDAAYPGPTDAWSSADCSEGETEISGSTMFSQECGEVCEGLPNYDCPIPSADCCELPCGPEGEIIGDMNFNVVEADSGSQKMCGEDLRRVNMIIRAVTPATVLEEFMMSVAEYTPDKGEAMFDVMSNEVNNFKELIKEIYNNRNDNLNDLLRGQQMQLKKKYDKWTNDLNKRTEQAQQKLKQLVPNFNMAAYKEDPEGYIYDAVMESLKKQGKSGKDSGGRSENWQSLVSERNYRVGLHKKTWLVREAEKLECENEARMAKLNEMMAQLACLSEGLATSSKKLAAYNRQLESQATCLRNKLTANERVINCLLDEVDKLKVEEEEEDVECGLIRPDDILTSYPRGYDYC